jgi:hypothetical protein
MYNLQEVNGVEVDRATFFDECHKTKNGRYVNDATEEKMVFHIAFLI